MSDLSLSALFNEIEQRVVTTEAAPDGRGHDLGALAADIERLCGRVVAERARETAPRLAALIERLDRLTTVLRERFGAGLDEALPPQRGAAAYRIAQIAGERR